MLDSVELGSARERCAEVALLIASDVDTPLLGLRGTTNLYGVDKGLGEDRLQRVDAQLERLALASRIAEPHSARVQVRAGGWVSR
ncbi:MAG: glycerate kinase [Nocardioidaceae bacterium]